MNKIYSKVWNNSLGHIVVASELARSHTRASGSSRAKKRTNKPGFALKILAATAGLTLAASAVAAPPSVPSPESPQPGLIIGTGGVIGGLGGTLDPLAGSVLATNDPYYHYGQLKLSKDNVTSAYSGGVNISLLNGVPDGLTGTLLGAWAVETQTVRMSP